MAINQIASGLPAATPDAAPSAPSQTATGVGSMFAKLVNAIESTNSDANTAAAGMLDGSTDVHDAMIALQRADMTLQLSVQIRNKLVSAYQEIMRMPV
jgi:flagellar hook-basal body complex protein FliE